ncbi:triacylglycerol lipase [Aquabacterium sp. A7-Y]|uniref:esterase/lipase family protein n=1 Tax=Aquabacterium sp. A7-Y TaxID=1349605 RepID=UPI00223E51FE|nr:triacylglycerol lipase [Aquabacterium sp. A7-Y]MCW7538315.1 triacylglycerol lipase [Aquabacterium sp. A7-Y]
MKRHPVRSFAAAACLGCNLTLAAAPAPALAADTYTQTRHPIVLVHGLFGWDSMGIADYWWGISGALRSGGATVHITQQSAANSSEVRGEQLLAELRRLRAAHGYQRFNLMGHSHGGQTVRYVAAVAPELVASVTTVGTPHQGSPVADAMKRGTDATGSGELVASLVNGFAHLIGLLSGNDGLPQNSEAAMLSLTTAGAASFNARFPAGAPTSSCGDGPAVANGVRYYSVGGTSVLTHLLDAGDALLGVGSLFFKGEANDGLVGRCSSRWGQVLRDNYDWNHIDQINHAFGLRGWFSADPVSFYRSQANRLKSAGL